MRLCSIMLAHSLKVVFWLLVDYHEIPKTHYLDILNTFSIHISLKKEWSNYSIFINFTPYICFKIILVSSLDSKININVIPPTAMLRAAYPNTSKFFRPKKSIPRGILILLGTKHKLQTFYWNLLLLGFENIFLNPLKNENAILTKHQGEKNFKEFHKYFFLNPYRKFSFQLIKIVSCLTQAIVIILFIIVCLEFTIISSNSYHYFTWKKIVQNICGNTN